MKLKLSGIILPVSLVVLYLVVVYLLKDILPGVDEIVKDFGKLFAKFGYEIIFVGAFLEAALIVNLFVPGTSLVLMGAYFSSIGILSYPPFLIVAAAGFLLGYLLDYMIGYFGLSGILYKMGFGKELAKVHASIEKMGGKAFFLGYIHPDSASLFAIVAGIVKMDIKEFLFYNLVAGSFWLTFWTILVYLFGHEFRKIFEYKHFWIIFLIPLFYFIFRSQKKWGVKKIIKF